MEAQVRPVPELPPELVDYVRLQATKDAERVSAYLEQQGVPKDRPLLLEHVRMLATGLRFREWDAEGTDLHVKHALPPADELLAFGKHELGTRAPELVMNVKAALEEHDSDLGGLVRSLKKIDDNHCDQVQETLRTLDSTYRDLPAKALAPTFENYAWSGPALLGVEVLINQPALAEPAPSESDDVIDRLAEFIVQHRLLLQPSTLDDAGHEQASQDKCNSVSLQRLDGKTQSRTRRTRHAGH